NGELVLTEGGTNNGLLTNHGILRTITGADFTNGGTYQSSGTDTFVGDFIGNDIERIASICVQVGGNLVPIDSTALLLAGAQTFSWYREFYRGESFIRILPPGVFPETKEVRGSNDCAIGFRYDSHSKRLVVITAIDNLVKGAAGQAVQNMNLMYGFDETEGLLGVGLVP
ncbi:MAG: Asd/ArgC dimerization domain-containing protein, partial [Candidatus Binatia bacterium]